MQLSAVTELVPSRRRERGLGIPGRVGVVDIGSNTVRLVVYDVPTRLPLPIFNEKAQCALGSGLARAADSTRRALTKRCAVSALCPLGGRDGCRPAGDGGDSGGARRRDGPAFVHAPSGLRPAVHVLSGRRGGAASRGRPAQQRAGADGVLGDVGGGSLDLVSLDGGQVGRFATLPLGHLRLAEDSGGDRTRAKAILEERLATLPWLAEMRGRTIYCVGGSWRALARIFIDQTHHPLHVIDNFEIGFFDALKLSDLMANLSSAPWSVCPGSPPRCMQSLPYAARRSRRCCRPRSRRR